MNTADLPKTLLEFEERFATEAACLAYVRAKKWPEGFRCAKCGGHESWPVRRLDECVACGHQESVTAGTLFHQTRKPLRLWFRAITLWVTSKRGLSARELSRQLGMHYETAWHWCHRLRACVGATFGKDQLNGVVEVDETYIGGSDNRAHGGRSLAGRKALIAGAVEVRGKGMGRARLEQLTGATSEKLQNFAVRNIEPHAVATTDGLAAYEGLPEVGIGHQQHVIGRDSRRAVKVLPRIHKLFSLFKRAVLGTFHGSVSHKHLPAYLNEFEFRFNRRNSASDGCCSSVCSGLRRASRASRRPPSPSSHNRWWVPEPSRHPNHRKGQRGEHNQWHHPLCKGWRPHHSNEPKPMSKLDVRGCEVLLVMQSEAYFDGEIDEEDRETMSLVETEVMARFPSTHIVTHDLIRLDAPALIPKDRTWVYFRREPLLT